MISCGCGLGQLASGPVSKADKLLDRDSRPCLPAAEILLKSCNKEDDVPGPKLRRAQNEAWSRIGFDSPAAEWGGHLESGIFKRDFEVRAPVGGRSSKSAGAALPTRS